MIFTTWTKNGGDYMTGKQNIFTKYSWFLIPAAMTLFSVLLSVLRCMYTGTLAFLFLNWNLFLAALPLGFAFAFSKLKSNKRITHLMKIILLLLWLFFFPNALYILTDFVHLGGYSWIVPKWFDFIQILSYSLCGLYYALASIRIMENCLKTRISPLKLRVYTIIVFYLSSFGIYLGRFLRWNSWDLFTRPHLILADVASLFTNPATNARAWVFTILLGTVLNLFYFTWKNFQTKSFTCLNSRS
jgi:uncharacterized membrane protein